MKCPLCDTPMKKADNDLEEFYCPAANCGLFGRFSRRTIRAIRRKLKAEYNRGVKDGKAL